MLNYNEYQKLQSLKAIRDSHYKKLPTKANQIGDRYWMLEIASKTTNINPVIDWHDMLDKADLPLSYLEPCQELALLSIGGYTNPKVGRIKVSSQAVSRRYIKKTPALLSLFAALKPNIHDWINFTAHDIQTILIDDFDRTRRRLIEDPAQESSAGFQELTERHQLLGRYTSSAAGRAASPFSISVLMQIGTIKDFLENYLKKINLTFAQVSSSRKGSAIPHHISMRWIVFMLSEFASDDLKYLRLRFLLMRELKISDGGTHHLVLRLQSAQKVKDGSFYFKQGQAYEKAKATLAIYERLSAKCFNQFKDIQETIGYWKITYKSRHETLIQTTRFVSHLFSAILLTNGPRKSEVSTLSLANFERVTDEASNYNSFIHKTMQGLGTIRSISGYVHDMALSVADIGEIDRLEKNTSLFYVRKCSASLDTYSNRKKLFNHSYQLFIDSLEEEDAAMVREEMPTVHTHQGRHSFFGYALRIGDHDTHEAIRKHARHEYRSWMTNHYTESKIRDIERYAIEREFISDLVGKLISKDEHGLFGPTVKTLETLINNHIEMYDVNSKSEMEELGALIADQFNQITVNEFGLCLPKISTLHRSKCWNKATKTPDYDAGSSFENCSGCIHYCGMKGHVEYIERVAIQASTTLEETPAISPSMKRLLELTLKNAERLIKEATHNG